MKRMLCLAKHEAETASKYILCSSISDQAAAAAVAAAAAAASMGMYAFVDLNCGIGLPNVESAYCFNDLLSRLRHL